MIGDNLPWIEVLMIHVNIIIVKKCLKKSQLFRFGSPEEQNRQTN